MPAVSATPETLASSLDRLATETGDREVLLVAGQPARPDLLSRPEPGVRLVTTASRGYAAHLAAGAAAARGEVLLFLDGHNRLPAGALAAIDRNLQLLPAMVGGNFHLKFEGHSLWTGLVARVLKQQRYQGRYFHGSGIFIRRAVYEALGGLDLTAGLPDDDLVQRMESYGPTLYLPETITLPPPSLRWGMGWLLAAPLASFGLGRSILKSLSAGSPML